MRARLLPKAQIEVARTIAPNNPGAESGRAQEPCTLSELWCVGCCEGRVQTGPEQVLFDAKPLNQPLVLPQTNRPERCA